jgi:hypothetical protein
MHEFACLFCLLSNSLMKSLLLLLTISLSVLANAQIKKGTVLLGGNIYGSTYKTDGSSPTDARKQSSIAISPSIGVATKENVVWGINASFSSDKYKVQQQSEYSSYTSYGAGVFTRRYMAIAKSFYLFGQAGIGYSNYKEEQPYFNGQTHYHRDTWGVNVNAYPGIAYGITRRIQLELGLPNMLQVGYNHTSDVYSNNTVQQESNTEGFNISMNLNPSTQLAVGFRILLGK